MALKARIKFGPGMNWMTEYKLIHTGKFRVHARKRGEFLILEKELPKTLKPYEPVTSQQGFEFLINGELPEEIQNNLRSRCNGVVCMFEDPAQHLPEIEARLKNISSCLPHHQRKFVNKWAIDNLSPENLV